MRIEDHRGVNWVVKAGDPASETVNALHRRGYEWVVLPRSTLTGNPIRGIMEERLPPGLVQRVRLLDCLAALAGDL